MYFSNTNITYFTVILQKLSFVSKKYKDVIVTNNNINVASASAGFNSRVEHNTTRLFFNFSEISQ